MTDVAVAWDTDWVFPDGSTAARGFTSGLPTALLVTETGDLSTGNAYLRDLLVANDYEVVVRTWADAEDYVGIDVVIISRGNPTGGDSGRYLSPPVGIVAVDSWRPLGMGTGLGFENTVNSVEVVDATSPLAGGVPLGTFAPYNTAAYITWNTDLSASPDVVVTRPSAAGQAVVFWHEAGDTMAERFATTRHVGVGYHEDGLFGGLTAEGEAQLLAAVEWARASGYASPPAPGAPTSLSAFGGNTSVSLSWTAPAYADSFTVKRSSVPGGPYTVVQSGITETSYTNTGLTNGTPYYFVVSATNESGEGPNSAEESATPTEVVAASTLSLHVTAEELAIWRQRWTTSTGDSFLNARIFSEKLRIMGHADTVAGDTTGHLWDIPPMSKDGSGRYNSQPDPSLNEGRQRAGRLLGAAFTALVTQNATRMNQIGSILHLQPDRTRCDFANDPGWAYGVQQMLDASVPAFEISHSVIQHLHTYSYFKAAVAEGWVTDLTSTQHQKIQDWYRAWADYCLWGMEARLDQAFNGGWTSGDYSSYITNSCTWCFGPIYDGSKTVYAIPDRFNNRFASTVRMVGLAGILLDDATYKERAWRATRDFLVYSVYPEGAVADNQRAHDDRRSQSYIVLNTSHVMMLVDAFARNGDSSLYDLETTDGLFGTDGVPSNTTGNSESTKSFDFLIKAVARYGNRTYDRYASGERIDFRGPFSVWTKDSLGSHDSWIYTNLYYQDSGISKDFYRGENGQPAWEIHGNGSTDLNDAWAFPAPYLMWAGLEGQVWPFPGVPQP